MQKCRTRRKLNFRLACAPEILQWSEKNVEVPDRHRCPTGDKAKLCSNRNMSPYQRGKNTTRNLKDVQESCWNWITPASQVLQIPYLLLRCCHASPLCYRDPVLLVSSRPQNRPLLAAWDNTYFVAWETSEAFLFCLELTPDHIRRCASVFIPYRCGGMIYLPGGEVMCNLIPHSFPSGQQEWLASSWMSLCWTFHHHRSDTYTKNQVDHLIEQPTSISFIALVIIRLLLKWSDKVKWWKLT